MPKHLKEIVADRTATSATWRNTDGSMTVEKYLAPHFYRAASGGWQPIVTTLAAVPGQAHTWRSSSNSWKVAFAPVGTKDGLEQITQGGQDSASLAFVPQGVSSAASSSGLVPSVTGSTATYVDLWAGTDLVENVMSTGVKEDITLKNPHAPASYAFALSGATAKTNSAGGLDVLVGGNTVGTIPAPTITTAGDPVGVATKAAGAALDFADGRVEVSVSSAWLGSLPASAFPVTIDPTYDPGGITHPNSVVAYSNSGSTTSEVTFGANTHGTWDSAVSIPLPAPPAEQNGQPWQLGFASLELSCQTSCSLTNVHAWNETSKPTSYAAVQTGGTVPTDFESSIYDSLYVFIGNSTYANRQSPWVGITASSSAFVQIPTSNISYGYTYYELPPPGTVTAPTDGSVLATTTPTLKTAVTDTNICASISSTCDEPDSLHYDFKISTAENGKPGQVVADSGWIDQPYDEAANGTYTIHQPTWTVPAGSLVDGGQYYATVQSTNTLIVYENDATDGNILITPPTGDAVSFKVKLRLGAGGPSPTDTVGSLPGGSPAPSSGSPSPGTFPSSETVNLVTGDLAVSVGTPQMTTVAGNAGITLHYDSLQSSTSGTAGSGGTSYGVLGQYYKDSGAHTYPSTTPVGTRIDPTVDMNGGVSSAPIGGLDPDIGTPGAGYITRWTGRITLPNSPTVPAGTTFQIGGRTTGGYLVKVAGTVRYSDWGGGTVANGQIGLGAATMPAGTAGTIEVDDWDANTAVKTSTQLWIKENFPDGTHSAFIVPSNWLTTTSTGLPPGWSMSAAAATWTSASDLGSEVVLHAATGATATFTRLPTGEYQAPGGDDDALVAGDGTLQLSTTAGYVYVFNGDGSLASLTSAADDRKPAALDYGYAPATSTDGSPVVLTTITDPVSNQQIHLYYGGQSNCPSGNDAPAGMLCEVNYWDGTSTGFSYNANAQLAEVLNPGASGTLFAYTASNQIDALRDALSNDYIAAAQPGSSACTAGTSATTCPFDTVITYDSSKRVATVSQPEPTNGAARPERTYTYQPSGSDPGAGTTLTTIAGFNPAGNSHIGASYAASETYDDQSRVIKQTSSTGLSSTTVWDNQDQPIVSVDQTGEQTSTVYDVNGNATDTYGPAPTGCFAATSWPSDTSYASPPAPIQGYLPVADPKNTTGCDTDVPHTQTGYDEGIDGLGIVYWGNGQLAGAPDLHGTGNGISNTTGASCTGASSGTSDDSLCATWPTGSAPGATDAQDNWSMKLSGDLTVPSAGTYEFVGNDTQPMTLFIDGDLVGTNKVYSATGALQSVADQFSDQVALGAGAHTLEIDIVGDTSQQTAYTLSDHVAGSGSATPIALTRTDPNYALSTSTTDADGKRTSRQYTASNGIGAQYGLPTVITVGAGGSTPLATTTNYETPGPSTYLRRTATELPDGATTTYGYWGDSQTLSSAICGVPAGTNQAGLLESMTDPAPTASSAAREQYFVYDAAGRKAARWEGPAGTSLSSIASDAWQCTTWDSRGRPLTQTWPAFGSAPARTLTYGYAVGGNPLTSNVSDTRASGGTVTTGTDLIGRMVTYSDTLSQLTQVSYNQAGQVTTNNGPRGALTYTYDPDSGNLATVSVNGTEVAWTYYVTATNRLGTVDYANGTGAAIGYDANGRENSLVYTKPGGSPVTVTGDQITTSPAGRIISELENINGALTNPNPAGPNATDYTYDDAGRLISASLPGSVATYGYGTSPAADACQQPAAGANTDRTNVTITPASGAATSTDYCYNNADQLTETLAGSSQISLIGTAQEGQNLNILQPDTPISLSYPAGVAPDDQALLAVTVPSWTSITAPNGYTLVGTYASNYLLGNNFSLEVFRHTITADDGAGVTVAFSTSSPRTAVLSVYRGVDPDDPIDASSGGITNSGTTVTAPSVTTTHAADRLVVFDGQDGSSTATWTPPSAMTTQSTSSGGDAMTAISADTTAVAAGPTPSETSTSSTSGVLVTALVALKSGTKTATMTYDAHGNQTQDGATTYTYDAADRLATTTVGGVTTSYTYDAVDRVTSRTDGTTTTSYGYGGYDSAPVDTSTTGQALQKLVSLPGGVTDAIQATGGGGGDLWSYSDLHGNTTVTADDNGSPVGQVINYDPWGTALADAVSTGNAAVTKNFTSFGGDAKITDPTSGITIMGARAYNAAEGRFTSVDPSEGGCANNYVYTFGDPFTQQDLTGYKCSSVGGILSFIASAAATGIGIAALVGSLPEDAAALAIAGALLGVYGASADGAACVRGDHAACGGAILGFAAAAGSVGSIAGAKESILKALSDSSGAVTGSGGLVSDTVTSIKSVSCGVANIFKNALGSIGL
jgi:RHS repeat-associated protein